MQHTTETAIADFACSDVKQLRRILPVRPVPSRDDRRLLNKVAKEAVRAQARSTHAA